MAEGLQAVFGVEQMPFWPSATQERCGTEPLGGGIAQVV